MKISSLKDINDENLKEIKATAVRDFLEDEMKKASDKWIEEKTAHERAVNDLTQKNGVTVAQLDKLTKDLEDITSKYSVLLKASEDKAKQDKFTARMSSFDDVYELNTESRSVIASQIKDMSDEAFVIFEKNMTVLMKDQSKAAKAKAKTQEVQASAVVVAPKTEVVSDAIDNAKTITAQIPNTTVVGNETLIEKFAKHFKLGEGIELAKR